MSAFMIDIESDGPIPGDYSMVSFGAVLVEDNLSRTFYGKLKPISDISREECLSFNDPKSEMERFAKWITETNHGKPLFFSDNNGFDWQFINWYFHHFTGENPFGHSSTNIGSLYKGMVGDMFKNFKHLRETKHTHNPVDDAMGNAEALLHMKKEMGLKISFK